MLKSGKIYKNYEGRPLLQGIFFCRAGGGDCLAFWVSPAAGKSTLLRIIAGFEAC
jgi:ABC-type multidrug transport system ATPase subunit